MKLRDYFLLFFINLQEIENLYNVISIDVCVGKMSTNFRDEFLAI